MLLQPATLKADKCKNMYINLKFIKNIHSKCKYLFTQACEHNSRNLLLGADVMHSLFSWSWKALLVRKNEVT